MIDRIYKALHKTASTIVRWCVVLPIGMLIYAFLVLALPLQVLASLLFCYDWEEFKDSLADRYIRMPRDYWNWCVLGN